MLKELDPLVSQYARSRQTLFKAVEGLSDAQLQANIPGRDWSIKDTCIHIATNEVLMTRLLQDIADGGAQSLAADFDNQLFNDQSVTLGRAKSMEQLRAELDASYKQLIAVLETVTPETIKRRGTHPAAGDADVKEFFLAMYAHHEVHCRDVVEQARRQRKS